MSTKVFNTRLQLKYDSWKNWYDNNPTLLAGEIAIVNVPAQTDESTGEVTQKPAILFKVGDGTTDFRTLDWASGLAADVYEWAKKEKGEASDIIYKSEVKDETGAVVTDAIYVNTAISSLEAAVKTLEGIFSEEGEDGTVTGISDIIKNYIDTNLNKADSAQTGKYVSAVSQSNGVITVERADLPTYTLVTGDTKGTVKFNGTDVAVKGLGSAAYEEKGAFDAAGTGAAEAAKVLGTTADEAGTATVYGALKSAAAAQATADNAYVLPEGGIEADLSAAVKASLAKADSAVQDVSALATKDELGDVSDRVEAIENDYLKAADKTELEGKITSAETTAKAYADDIKEAILGGEGLKDTFDTLLEIQNWIEGDGVNTTELTKAIADETKAREEADTALSNRIKAYEDAKDTYATVSALEEVEAIADAARTEAEVNSQIDAKITALDLANTYDAKGAAADAETKAKAYTDDEIDKLHTVATTGKLGDLTEDETATAETTDYVVFYCGTSEILTK